MAKPILIVRFPYDSTRQDNLEQSVHYLASHALEYTVIPFLDSKASRLEFEVLNAEKVEQQDIDQIQKHVNEILCQQNQTSTTE